LPANDRSIKGRVLQRPSHQTANFLVVERITRHSIFEPAEKSAKKSAIIAPNTCAFARKNACQAPKPRNPKLHNNIRVAF
jgi:hypothetical protein